MHIALEFPIRLQAEDHHGKQDRMQPKRTGAYSRVLKTTTWALQVCH